MAETDQTVLVFRVLFSNPFASDQPVQDTGRCCPPADSIRSPDGEPRTNSSSNLAIVLGSVPGLPSSPISLFDSPIGRSIPGQAIGAYHDHSYTGPVL
jgi:hypothetical protein